MKKFDEYPRSFKKTIRYIKQEATLEQLNGMEPLLLTIIQMRKKELSVERGVQGRKG
ncbi:hypothetical protein [Paenibacillus ginsengihumi]|uniref:hypothetical protein n=1 Tax=Paenibacillus ginsengihumi TaxID=431596 RepID=UPI000371B3D6|nr:hypothetical protein [Paenibacillus ginsengihumi]